MATRNSTSKARPSRKKSRKVAAAIPVATDVIPRAIEDSIEAERTRLMTVHTLLSCAALAMDAEDLSFEGPHYLTVLDLARDLVNQAINNLEPMALESVLGQSEESEQSDESTAALVEANRHRVREPLTGYWIH